MKKWHLISIAIIAGGLLIGYAIRYPIFNFGRQAQSPVAQQAGKSASQFPKSLIAVSIENSPEARPQYGLSLANVVFETVTEGGITRLLAFYGPQDVPQIGPVRSARPYFLDWALGFAAPFVHSGGSKEALARIDNNQEGIKDLNEFYNGKYFWRDQSKAAPHNLFTSSGLLQEAVAAKNWPAQSVSPGWGFKVDQPLPVAAQTAKVINIDFSYDPFAVKYVYDAGLNDYQRFLAGQPHVDGGTNQQIRAKNVVILYTTSSVLDEKLLTIDLQTIGAGKAQIFRDGGMLQGRWEKLSAAEPLRLLDADDSLIGLNNGPTWIEVVDQHGTASWQ